MSEDVEAAAPEPTKPTVIDDPDELLFLRIRGIFNSYVARQSEILRLASYIDERAAEVDSASERAKALINAKISSPDVNAIEQLLGVFNAVEHDDLGDEDLTQDERQDAFSAALQEVGDSLPEGLLATYIEATLEALVVPPATGFLRPPLLVTLVGELEMVVKSLARAAFERYPQALGDEGRTLSWAEISTFDSIDDIRDSFVDQVVDEQMRGSLTDWVEYLCKRFKLAAISGADSFDAQEAVQRRHCIVHNAGMVSPGYLDKLSRFNIDVAIDEDLPVDAQYLQRASDALYLVAYQLCWGVAFKLTRTANWKEAFGGFFVNRLYYLLQQKRYDLVMTIGREAPSALLAEQTAFVLRVNYWLAHKLTGRFEEIRGEVESLDVRSRSNDVRLAKHALLGEVEEAYALATSMIASDELRPEFLFTWPLLADVREFASRKANAEDLASPPGTD